MFEATDWILEEPDVSDETKFDLISPTVVRPPCTTKMVSLKCRKFIVKMFLITIKTIFLLSTNFQHS